MTIAQTANRRQFLFGVMTAAAIGCKPALSSQPHASEATTLKITCFIRYQIDPFQRDEFKQYADTWGNIIPRCGGHLVGYFLPLEGTNDIGWALIGFESLAAYEAYRTRLRSDIEAKKNFSFAQAKRFILREERTFLEVVDATFNRPSSTL